MRIQKKCEHTEQVALINWARANEGKYPELRNLFAIPNGGKRSSGWWEKSEGLKSGVPDLFLGCQGGESDVPCLGRVKKYSGMFIEMKFGKNKPNSNQRDWIKRLRDENYKVSVCYSFEEARDEILHYLRECQ